MRAPEINFAHSTPPASGHNARPRLSPSVNIRTGLWLLDPNILEQSIGVRESQDARVAVVWVGDWPESKVGELCRNFRSALRGFGFNHQSVRAPTHNGDVSSIAEFAGGSEPRRILGAGEERHRGEYTKSKTAGRKTQ